MIGEDICTKYQTEIYPLTEFCGLGFSYVYIFYNPETKLTKIGIAEDTYKRQLQVTAACGNKVISLIDIELEPEYDEPAKVIESFLHNYFKRKRTFGEWFKLSIIDLAAIHRLFFEVINGYYINDNLEVSFEKLFGERLFDECGNYLPAFS